ncbi:MAG: sugar phosphate nucleotidyltransferase [Planctomycetota bacterium]
MTHSDNTWAVVLAAGSGTRLQALTTTADGVCVPKQFCSLRGGRTLLLDAVGRALQLAPASRIVIVVAADHECWWSPQLRGLSRANVLVQPRNVGTAAGLALAVAAIRARDPRANVAVLASDHHVDDPSVLRAAHADALAVTRRQPERIVLLGITPDEPDSEYGWIVPGPGDDSARGVATFVEKPGLARATELMRSGGVWNSFLMAARAETLWQLVAARLPFLTTRLAAAFAAAPAMRSRALDEAYASMPVADFSRDVLQGNEDRLAVQIVPPCGWTDLGTPSRVAQRVAQLDTEGVPARAPWFATVDLRAALLAQRARHAIATPA